MVDSFEFEVIIKEEWFKPKDFNPRYKLKVVSLPTQVVIDSLHGLIPPLSGKVYNSDVEFYDINYLRWRI